MSSAMLQPPAASAASLGLLVVLESLSPLERAVFVLREAFDLPFADIARILERSEAAVRQIARRSRGHVAERRARYDADPRCTERSSSGSWRPPPAATSQGCCGSSHPR